MKHILTTLTILLLTPLNADCASELKLAAMFSDHMLLQRDRPVPVWGWSDAREAGNSAMAGAGEGRTVISLNGVWQIEESVTATEIPAAFTHTVVVPGLVNLSAPAFPQVDWFASREYLERFGRRYPWGGPEILAKDAPLPVIGIALQKRNYFWYQTTFTVPKQREVALLRIGKSQFGTKVWVNGKEVGEHLSCWTAGYFNLTAAIKWSGANRLLVRIGAHPAVLPENIPGAGTYSSKHRWTPGIYDDVSLILCDNPVIESIQVAPRINASEVVVQTKVKNRGAARTFELGQVVKTWKEGREVAQAQPRTERIEAGEEQTYTQIIRIPDVRLWSPDDPFLYSVTTRAGGDSLQTRFGMREFRFDNAAGRGWLNGKPTYLRGGNIELFLHAEDPLCGDRPWDRTWVRKLIAEIPAHLNWNAFRFCLSPVPEMWLDIADEEGILVQCEPIVWGYRKQWDAGELTEEYGRWMRDNWNHPSVFMWDSNNETVSPELGKIVKAVRSLDLSGRAWDNGWSPPVNPDDPAEAHPYLVQRGDFADLRRLNKLSPDGSWGGWNRPAPGHCRIINEYCWLWLYSDGTPIDLTGGLYHRATPHGTAQDRQQYRWYLTAALTEMWRAQRPAGVLYYGYLGSYLPRTGGPYHFGAFADLATLRLQPEFLDYMTEAFKPLGVYLRFWGDGEPGNAPRLGPWFPIRGGAEHPFSVVMINDDPAPVEGKLMLSIETQDGAARGSREWPFRLAGLGREAYELNLPVPEAPGKYLLKATAWPQGSRHKGPTVCRRTVSVEPVPAAPAIERKQSRAFQHGQLLPVMIASRRRAFGDAELPVAIVETRPHRPGLSKPDGVRYAYEDRPAIESRAGNGTLTRRASEAALACAAGWYSIGNPGLDKTLYDGPPSPLDHDEPTASESRRP